MKTLAKSILFLTTFLAQNVSAQNIYSTQNGLLEVGVFTSGAVEKLESKKLLVMLNYEDATFEMRIDGSTLYGHNDSINEVLSKLNLGVITLTGQFGVDYINTQGHPPLDFNVQGVLSTNSEVIEGTAHLEHLSNKGIYSCVLTMDFDLLLKDLGLNLSNTSDSDKVQVKIVQIVLNRIEDQ